MESPPDEVRAGITVSFHFMVIGLIAWATGRPFLFPSLGPSAYLLATGERPREEGAYHVIGGHAVATLAGMIAFAVAAGNTSAYVAFERPEAAFSPELLALVVSATLAMTITTVAMLLTRTNHPAACATTLIVALGLMGGVADAVVIVTAVTVLVGMHDYVIEPVAKRYGFWPQAPRE